jgi:Flp pilus assembly protein TadD
MQPILSPSMHRISICALTASLLILGGCVTRGSAQNSLAQRVQTQQDVARQENLPVQADSRATYLQLVVQMQQKGLYFASLAHVDALQQRWGVDVESNLLLADALRQTGQLEKASALYSQLLATSAKARAAHGLGLLAGRANDYQSAVGYLQQASQAAPTDADVLNDLGFVLIQQGKWKEARVPLMKASELASDNPRIWSNIALFLTLDGQVAQANEVMDSRKLSVASRNQIAELARSIQQRGQPVAMAPDKNASPSVNAAVATPVSSPTLGVTSLMSLQSRSTAERQAAITSDRPTTN